MVHPIHSTDLSLRKLRLKSRDDRNTENEARPDELGNDPAQVGPDSAGQSGDAQGLSEIEDEASVEELAEEVEASIVQGAEDAADHPERPTHTHEENIGPDDVSPARR
jgi:hypothetical protein